MASITIEEKFTRCTVRAGECLIWAHAKNSNGSGIVRVMTDGKSTVKLATHVSWFLNTGSWPKYNVLHISKCSNIACVEFTHLYQGRVRNTGKAGD